MKYDILISGVGGQGQVLASRLLGAAAIESGLIARTGETIGMAQRGGCVISNVRIGPEETSPSIPLGMADLIIGFELCETARVLGRLSPGGKIILNRHIVSPVPVSLGFQAYDADAMLEAVKKAAGTLLIIDANALAREQGSEKAANVVLLGAASGAGFLPFSEESVINAINKTVPKKYLSLNLAAFHSGYQYAKEQKS